MEMTFQSFFNDLDRLTVLLKEQYSNDPRICEWNTIYCGTYYEMLKNKMWDPADLEKENENLKQRLLASEAEKTRLERENESFKEQIKNRQRLQKPSLSEKTMLKQQKYEKIREKIQQSFSEERRITGNVEIIKTSTIGDCISTLKDLDKLINSDKRNIILLSGQKGRVLKDLKTFTKRENFLLELEQCGLKYSLSHCNFLIRLFVFAEAHPNILKCSISIEFICKHFKAVKQVFQDLGW
ncbi:MAG: hypothetical protein AB2693_07325 [Candidatus Thiodiazotropha sp.]